VINLWSINRMKEFIKKMFNIQCDKQKCQQSQKTQHHVTEIHEEIKKRIVEGRSLDTVKKSEKTAIEKEKIKNPDRAIVQLEEIYEIAFYVVAYVKPQEERDKGGNESRYNCHPFIIMNN